MYRARSRWNFHCVILAFRIEKCLWMECYEYTLINTYTTHIPVILRIKTFNVFVWFWWIPTWIRRRFLVYFVYLFYFAMGHQFVLLANGNNTPPTEKYCYFVYTFIYILWKRLLFQLLTSTWKFFFFLLFFFRFCLNILFDANQLLLGYHRNQRDDLAKWYVKTRRSNHYKFSFEELVKQYGLPIQWVPNDNEKFLLADLNLIFHRIRPTITG